MILLSLLACASAAPPSGVTHLGTVGSGRFWHEHAVQDVHVLDDGTLHSIAGCAVHHWSREGKLLGSVQLEGCTAGLDDGFFSADGAWVAASGLWVGEQGVWRATGGKRVHEVESLLGARFCTGGLWDVDGPRGFRRLDLATGEVTHPSGDHGTNFVCVGDAWMLDEHGHRIDPDGTVVELPDAGDIRRVVGQTGDAAVVYLYEQRLVLVDHDGTVTPSVPVPDVPELVVPVGADMLFLDDGVDDVVWRISPDGRIAGGPWFAEGQGLGSRSGMGALFLWGGEPWGWGGHRIFPLGDAVGPVDTTYERFFFDADELYLCRGSTCEVRRVDALEGPVRTLHLPQNFDDDVKLSPTHRFLGTYDTRQLFRVALDTGEVQVQPVGEWVDGVAIDARGHFRWRLSEDEDEDDVYVTRVFERRDGEDVVLGRWRERWLSDPGWSVLQLGPTLRWVGGKKAGYDEADNWLETPDGHVVLAKAYGSGLEVYGPSGDVVASSRGSADNMGTWADGAWIGRGQQVLFVGPDLKERARLTIPWPLGDWAVEGAGSPDGRHFAARGPGGTVHVWRVAEGIALPAPPEPEPLAPFTLELTVGTPLGAPTYAVAEVSLFPEDDLHEPTRLLVAMASFAPRTAQERMEQLAAIRELSSGWDDEELHQLKGRWVAVQRGETYLDYDTGEDRVPDPDQVAADLERLVKKHKARKLVEEHRAWLAATPLPETPAFGLAGCHPLSAEPHLTAPEAPAKAASARPRRLLDGIVVKVAEDGTPSWAGTLADTRGDAARRCWRQHDAPWTPATRDGQPAAMCVLVPCFEPSDE